MTDRLAIAHAYEEALFAGDMKTVKSLFAPDIVYWVAGQPPIGGEWHGADAVVGAFANREFGLGQADWEFEEVWRDWYTAEDRVIVEIREKSWLKSSPDDVLDARTCVVIRFRDDRICVMRDYTDAYLYERFVERHRAELPKFAGR
ncbi:MAG: nuclear transport factor 2 family protein [Gemmatimonadales bacterium]